MRTLWFIDDRADNRDAWRAAFAQFPPDQLTLETFASLAAFEGACATSRAPDAVFVDFFIEGHYGHEAIAVLRRTFGAGPVVVAHSSMPEANAAMLGKGGDCALEKAKGASPSPTVAGALPDLAALEALLALRKLAPTMPETPR